MPKESNVPKSFLVKKGPYRFPAEWSSNEICPIKSVDVRSVGFNDVLLIFDIFELHVANSKNVKPIMMTKQNCFGSVFQSDTEKKSGLVRKRQDNIAASYASL